MNEVDLDNSSDKLLLIVPFVLAIVTLITFFLAMIAVPISGANAANGGIPYPYLDTAKQYPRDYIWQISAMLLILVYVFFYYLVQCKEKGSSKSFRKMGFIFAIMASTVLLLTYYTQVNVVPISIMSNEKDGVALVTQYNPHGLFIAQEELGYWLMLLSLACLIPGYKMHKFLSIANGGAVIIAIVFFVIIVAVYGLDRKDRFETVVISIDWILLIVDGMNIGIQEKRSHSKKRSTV